MIIQRLALCAAFAAALSGPATAAEPEPFRAEPWIADLEQLRDALNAGYANLDWQAERGMDLAAAYARAQQRLQAARDTYAARRAIDRFVDAFADGHLDVRWPPRPAPPAATAAPDAAAGPVECASGYFEAGDRGAIATRLDGYRPVGRLDAPLPAGVLTAGGRKVGVLRVPVFTARGFPALCREVLEKTPPRAGPCDDDCIEALNGRVDAAFVDLMRGQLAAIAAERPDALLIDVADNPGGDNSPLALAGMVTERPVRRPRVAMARGEPLARELAARQAELQPVLGAGPPAQRAALARFHAALTNAIAEAGRPCDRAGLWTGRPAACGGLVAEPTYDGPVPALKPGDPLPDWVAVAAPGARFPNGPPVWRGPLIVLVDVNSASSSELFAAMLQDAGAAVILGSRSSGAGCGHMTGAGPVTLSNSGGIVSMPDCVRLRADGSNEVAGIQPDVLVGLRDQDSAKQRVDLVSAALPAAIDLATSRARAGR